MYSITTESHLRQVAAQLERAAAEGGNYSFKAGATKTQLFAARSHPQEASNSLCNAPLVPINLLTQSREDSVVKCIGMSKRACF